MLHGFATSRATWDDILPLMSQDRYTLYLLDLKGFGLSPKPRDGQYDIEAHAALVEEFLAQQGLDRVTLVGHSFGGAIALATLFRLQDKGKKSIVDKLILIDAAIYPQPLPFFIALMAVPVVGPLFLLLLPTRFAIIFTLRSLYWRRERVTEGKIQRYAEIFRQPGMRYVMHTMARKLVPPEPLRYTSRYAAITVPILAIWGAYDRLLPLAQGKRIAVEIPKAKLQVIDQCGHNPQEEEPAQTVRCILHFLEGRPDE